MDNQLFNKNNENTDKIFKISILETIAINQKLAKIQGILIQEKEPILCKITIVKCLILTFSHSPLLSFAVTLKLNSLTIMVAMKTNNWAVTEGGRKSLELAPKALR